MSRTGALLSLLLALAGACRAPIDLPAGFVQLRDQGGDFSALTSDDAQLWVRELYDPTTADLDYWTEALCRDFERRGHEIVARGEIANASGQPGRWLELRATVRGERIGYLAAVWVHSPFWLWFWRRGDELQVVEFAARLDAFAAHVEAVRAALGTVRR